jgi:hypothetical protein
MMVANIKSTVTGASVNTKAAVALFPIKISVLAELTVMISPTPVIDHLKS